jgi:hypothetical protein
MMRDASCDPTSGGGAFVIGPTRENARTDIVMAEIWKEC